MKTQPSVPLNSKGPEEHMSTVEIWGILAAGLCLPGCPWALNSLCSKVSATPPLGVNLIKGHFSLNNPEGRT